MAFDWSFTNTPLFMIIVQIYFLILAGFVLYFAFKTRNSPEKKGHSEYFINEFLMGILLVIFVIIFPFYYNQFNLQSTITNQIYFHTWDSLTVNAIVWTFYFIGAHFTNKKYNTSMTYDQFKEKFNATYHDSLINDFTRKFLHIIGPPIMVAVFLICNYFSNTGLLQQIAPGWSANFASTFIIVCIILGFLFALTLADIVRFFAFPWFNTAGHCWMMKALRSERD